MSDSEYKSYLSTLTYEQLLNIDRGIDKELNPERASLLSDELESRESKLSEKKPSEEEQKNSEDEQNDFFKKYDYFSLKLFATLIIGGIVLIVTSFTSEEGGISWLSLFGGVGLLLWAAKEIWVVNESHKKY